LAEAGEKQFMLWRRGFRVRPPLGEPDGDPRYAALPPDVRPRGESLYDVVVRLLPYWCDMIVPDLYRYGCVLVVSHGNTLRALIKHIEAVSDAAASLLEVPNASPLCYEFQSGQLTRLPNAAR
jgi:2,3-bisphosphoglycerate-dependent phosphoglycerate mutase